MKTKQIEEDDEEVRILLMTEDSNLPVLMERVYSMSKGILASAVKLKHPGLTDDDQASAVQDAYVDLVKGLRSKSIDLERPLVPLLITFANRRAIDLYRKRNGKRKPKLDLSEDEFMDSVTAINWKRMTRSGEAKEILEEFRLFVANCAPAKRAVGLALLSLIPPQPSAKELCDAVAEITGKRHTIPTTTGYLSELRRDFRRMLEDSGNS